MPHRRWVCEFTAPTEPYALSLPEGMLGRRLRVTLEDLDAIAAAPSPVPGLLERDWETNPYSPDEQRVAEWMHQRAPDVGAGPDPIAFLMASYELLVHERNQLRAQVQPPEPEAAHEPS